MKQIFCLLLALLIPLCAFSESGADEEAILTLPEDRFAATILEIGSHLEEYEGKTLRMSGYVVRLRGEQGAQFCVLRDYNCCGGTDYTPYGFDCFWEGELPEEGAWVTVTGAIGRHERASGYPYLLLTLTELEPAEQGARVVYG